MEIPTQLLGRSFWPSHSGFLRKLVTPLCCASGRCEVGADGGSKTRSVWPLSASALWSCEGSGWRCHHFTWRWSWRPQGLEKCQLGFSAPRKFTRSSWCTWFRREPSIVAEALGWGRGARCLLLTEVPCVAPSTSHSGSFLCWSPTCKTDQELLTPSWLLASEFFRWGVCLTARCPGTGLALERDSPVKLIKNNERWRQHGFWKPFFQRLLGFKEGAFC